MANQEPVERAADDAPVIVVPEKGTRDYDDLIKLCKNQFNIYIETRKHTVRTWFSGFFNSKKSFVTGSGKGSEVDKLKDLLDTWQPSNAANTKKFLMELSLIADKAQDGVSWPKWVKHSDLLNTINEVKDQIWIYLIKQKPNVQAELLKHHEDMINALKNDSAKNSPPDDLYKLPSGANKFKNKYEQLEYETEHLLPSGKPALNALNEAQGQKYRIIP